MISSSPGKLDAIIKSLVNSPKPLFLLGSRTPPISQGLSTSNEDTDVQKVCESEHLQAGDFSSLQFEEDIETQDCSVDKKEDMNSVVAAATDVVETPQNLMQQTFGYQQRMNMEQRFGGSPPKLSRNKKKKKRWQERNMQRDFNFGNYNMNPAQTNFTPKQGVAPWRGQSQGFQGNQFYCGGRPVGLEQGPTPQVAPGNFAGNFPQQGPPLPNFNPNIPPPTNIPPMDFFRKVPPPNFQQQNQPMMMQQNPLMPQQSVRPPPLHANQPPFFSPNQQSTYNRPPPPLAFQANVPAPPSSQFPPSSSMQHQQYPQANFPPQPNQFPSFNSPNMPVVNALAAQELSPQGTVPMSMQQQAGHTDVEAFSLQTGAVSTSSVGMYVPREEPEPCTPSPVKHNQTHLPPHWKSATDPQGKVYYYHTQTR